MAFFMASNNTSHRENTQKHYRQIKMEFRKHSSNPREDRKKKIEIKNRKQKVK